MSEHHPDHTPWPLWAARAYSQRELAARLEVSTRTIRRALESGDVEKLGEQGGVGQFRLKDTPWSRAKIAAVSPEDVRTLSAPDTGGASGHGGGHGEQGKESSGDEDVRTWSGHDRTLSGRLAELEQENAHLRGEVEQLTRALELALASRPPSTPWLIVQLVALWNWFKSRGERG